MDAIFAIQTDQAEDRGFIWTFHAGSLMQHLFGEHALRKPFKVAYLLSRFSEPADRPTMATRPHPAPLFIPPRERPFGPGYHCQQSASRARATLW
ncbi:MAG: hypothetical protein P4L33_05885 [Capsulimonadaceae bacterium]|nr:hypothetical protein [Capsulimonadaceae bacterium]